MIGRIKSFLIALFLSLGPVIYVIGLRSGKVQANADRVSDIAKANKDLADFHQRMAEDDPETLARNDRDALIDRLRTKGL